MSSRQQKGSRRHVQECVNDRPEVLNARLRQWPSLSSFLVADPRWVSPLQQDGYRELRDDLWEVADLPNPPQATGFWPRGGPSWDAVAILPGANETRGLLLVEAKSRPPELASSCRASHPASARMIERSLAETREALDAPPDANWMDGYFQMANRLAFLYYLREKQGVPAWLWSVYFLDDWTVGGPATVADWEPSISEAEEWLGLPAEHRLSEFTRKDFIEVPEVEDMRSAASPSDIAIATKLADEISATGRRRRAWRKVTTLMQAFEIRRLTPAARARLAAALAAVGIEADPPLETAARSGTVRLARAAGRAGAFDSHQARTPSDGSVVAVTEWVVGHRPRDVAVDEPASESGIRWYDIDVLEGDEEAVFEVLEPLCPGLTFDVVKDLFEADSLPKVESHAAGEVQVVSAVAAFATEPIDLEELDARTASKAGQLEFQLVEMASGNDWLVSAWHAREVFRGTNPEPLSPRPAPHGQDVLREAIAREWIDGRHAAAGDLGTLVLHQLVATYAHARREMYSWLDLWEADFYERGDETERDTLIDLRSLVAQFRQRLNAFNQPGVADERAWFQTRTAGTSAQAVDNLVDRSLRDLRELSDSLRACFDLLASTGASRHLELAKEQQQATAREQRQTANFQDILSMGAAILLVPTLIAGIFGANTELPGKETWGGFVLLVVCMVSGASLAVVGVLAIRRHQERRLEQLDSTSSQAVKR